MCHQIQPTTAKNRQQTMQGSQTALAEDFMTNKGIKKLACARSLLCRLELLTDFTKKVR
jgi:hypothetical protein